MKALCIGHSTYDFSCTVDKFPEENSKKRINDVIECGGGPASNAAYLLGKYGVETYVASVVGDDTFGSLIKKELEKVGVHTEYMETAYDRRTSLSFIMVNKEKNTRTSYNVAKERLHLKKTEFQMDPDLILVDGNDYGASLAALNRYSSKISVIDAGRYDAEVLELCKYCKYIVTSKEFAENVAKEKITYENPQSLVNVYTALLNKFPGKILVVTLEDKGALYMVDGQIRVMPGLKVETVDTTGAGDIFHGAFAYALLQGYDIEKTVTFANIAAGLSVTKIGSRNSIVDISDIMVYFKQKYPDPVASLNEEPKTNTPNEGNMQA